MANKFSIRLLIFYKKGRNFIYILLNGGYVYPEIAWVRSGINIGLSASTAPKKFIADNLWHKVDMTLQNSPNAIGIHIDNQLANCIGSNIYRRNSHRLVTRSAEKYPPLLFALKEDMGQERS